MIIVTGAAGFIGSNIIQGLNELGIHNIVAVDDLTEGQKFINLADVHIADYLDKADFLKRIQQQTMGSIQAIFHEGACSATTEWNGQFMMENNYEYSKILLHYCLKHKIPFLYASSAAVYGNGTVFQEKLAYEKPLNVYGYSKYLFDQVVRRVQSSAESQIVGFRYFNVYGPREQHKGTMASVAYHFNEQIKQGQPVKLFEGTDGYGPGEQRRDFVYVQDVVRANLWMWKHPDVSGIFNIGTGKSQTFNDVANAVIAWHQRREIQYDEIQYIPFPEHLKGRYQSFTEADLSALRAAGYDAPFHTVEAGVKAYLDSINIS